VTEKLRHRLGLTRRPSDHSEGRRFVCAVDRITGLTRVERTDQSPRHVRIDRHDGPELGPEPVLQSLLSTNR